MSPRAGRLEKEMANHSSILAWTIPWTEEPGGLWSTGSHRNGHKWGDCARTCAHRVGNLIYVSALIGCFGLMEPRLHVCHFSFEKNKFSGHHSWLFSVLLNGCPEVQLRHPWWDVYLGKVRNATWRRSRFYPNENSASGNRNKELI